ncbi:MAG: hypothetical protein ACI9TY_000988 [Alphaproteobacteria bacterium]|jgi:hypothetical protein
MTTQAISNSNIQEKYNRLMGRSMLCVLVFGILALVGCSFFMTGGLTVTDHELPAIDVKIAISLFLASVPFGVFAVIWFIMAFQKSFKA